MKKILNIMKRLRGKNGCPWDRKQTLRSLKKCVLEEAHEILDAIDSGKTSRIEEEIGDMFCSLALLIVVGEEKKVLSKDVIVQRAVRKMISRHPHVFGKEKATTAEDALRFFQKVKEAERKKKKESIFEDLGKNLPALMCAEKIQKKVSRVGFDWPDETGVVKKVEEEWEELTSVLKSKNKERIKEELGDFLFSAVNLARKKGIDAEMALLEANVKFKRRFNKLEKLAAKKGLSFSQGPLPLEKLDALWDQVKASEKKKK